jgi:hypothetical protein
LCIRADYELEPTDLELCQKSESCQLYKGKISGQWPCGYHQNHICTGMLSNKVYAWSEYNK